MRNFTFWKIKSWKLGVHFALRCITIRTTHFRYSQVASSSSVPLPVPLEPPLPRLKNEDSGPRVPSSLQGL